MTTNKKILTVVFKNRDDVEKGYQAVIDRGYSPEEINFIMSEDTRNKYFKEKNIKIELGDKSAEGLGIGSAVGGAIGGLSAAIAAIGTALVLPGLGIIVAGPLAAGLAGAGAGGIAGGLVGTLIGMGISEERVKQYEDEINSGGILMGVDYRSEEDAKLIATDWKKFNPVNTKY